MKLIVSSNSHQPGFCSDIRVISVNQHWQLVMLIKVLLLTKFTMVTFFINPLKIEIYTSNEFFDNKI